MTEEQYVGFKPSYIAIFSINYLFQGVVQSLFAVIIPIYLLFLLGGISPSEIAFLGSIILIPFSTKLLYGILTDKFGSKKFGRRKPWIIGPSILAGTMWIIVSALITPSNAISLLVIAGLLIYTGVAMSDTALDGLMLDITPKAQLGRAQGFCWSSRSVGVIGGGPILAFLLVTVEIITVELIFMIMGILMITTSLFTVIIKEAREFPEVRLKEHIKGMFNRSKDWKVYFYATFNSMIDYVVVIFLSLYILIQMNLIEFKGTSLSLGTPDLNIYLYQANISLIICVGIIIGAIIGGQIADKISRRVGVYSSFLLLTVGMLLMLMDINLVGVGILLLMASIIGFGMGFRHSGYSAVIGEMSKQHPEMDSTYFAVCNSFANLGGPVGLALTGLMFAITGSFAFVFIFMALFQNLSLIFFKMLDPKDYEYKLKEKEK